VIQMSQLQRDIEALPEEAQSLLVDFVDLLKRRYSQPGAESQTVEKSNFEKFEQVVVMLRKICLLTTNPF
jgi:hypothetical protein